MGEIQTLSNHTKFKPSRDVEFSSWLYRQDRLTDYSQIQVMLIHSLVHAADRGREGANGAEEDPGSG